MNIRTSYRRHARHSPMLAVAALLLLAGCVTPETDENGEVVERECRSFDTPGSNMRRSVCRTPAEWTRIDVENTRKQNSQDEFFRRTLEQSTLGAGVD